MNIEGRIALGDKEVLRIGLGTNRLVYTPASVAFVRAAVAAGVGLIDTAHVYTAGESETTIGAALSPVPNGCVVATKGANRPGEGRPQVLRTQIEESLRRLCAESIELYYLHRVDPQTPLGLTLALIEEYRAAGKIHSVGLSEVGIDEIEHARQITPILSVQNHYNLSERKHEDVVDYCAQEGIVFVPFRPLRENSSPVLAEIAQKHGAAHEQIALAWLLRRSPTILPIPGTLSLSHLKQNLAALEIELSDDEFEALN